MDELNDLDGMYGVKEARRVSSKKDYGIPNAERLLFDDLANALGWRRVEAQRHQDLQDRLVFAARIDREPHRRLRMTDFQTAQLGGNDRGWTTRNRAGKPCSGRLISAMRPR